ncbi:MAG: hypothetical protein V3U02_04450 [Calditrichia bacterium]
MDTIINTAPEFGLAVIIVGLTELMKKLGMPTKFLPITSVVIGAILSPFMDGTAFVAQGYQVAFNSILYGAFVGMVTTGLIGTVKGKKTK